MKRSQKFGFIVLLTCLSSLGLVSSDIYLPSLPTIAERFHVPIARAQLTLSLFLLGLAAGQLLYGWLSDLYGRKMVLLSGMVVFALGSLACALAPSLPFLIVARLFQALGACAGLVIGRAVVTDFFEGQEAARVLAIIYPLVAMSPALSPILGGYLHTWFGWRSAFYTLFIYAVLLTGAIRVYLPESRKGAKARALNPRELFRAFCEACANPRFIGFTASICCAYGAYFAYISASPFLFQKMGGSAIKTGFMYAPVALPYIGSALFGRMLVRHIRPETIISIGVSGTLVGGLLLYAMARYGSVTEISLLVPMAIIAAGNGFILPFSMASAIALFPVISGSVSGMVGSAQLASASLASAMVGKGAYLTAQSMAQVVVAITSVGFFVTILCLYKKEKAAASVAFD